MKIVRKTPSDKAIVPDVPAVLPPAPPTLVKQPSERRMDEEAVSRMDSEGGVPDAPVVPPVKHKKVASGR